MNWPDVPLGTAANADQQWQRCLDAAETYLCELKEAQIRTGLHRLGERPSASAEHELLMALARPPAADLPGLTQMMASRLGLGFDPWSEEDGEPLTTDDRNRLADLGCSRARRVGDGTAWLEEQALLLLNTWLNPGLLPDPALDPILLGWCLENPPNPCLGRIRDDLWPRLLACADAERQGG